MPTYLAIDPGTTNLGWVLYGDDEIVDCGLDTIWLNQKPARQSLTNAVVGWYRDHSHLFSEADEVLIEQQYSPAHVMGIFPPLIVMEVLFALSQFEYPGKATLISAAAVKKHYEITGSYEDRKTQVVRLAGLNHLQGRVHDIADCVLLCWYRDFQKKAASEKAAAQNAKAQLRAKLRAQHTAHSVRDLSPVRAAPASPQVMACKLCGAVDNLIGRRKRNEILCKPCYQREYRRQRKLK